MNVRPRLKGYVSWFSNANPVSIDELHASISSQWIWECQNDPTHPPSYRSLESVINSINYMGLTPCSVCNEGIETIRLSAPYPADCQRFRLWAECPHRAVKISGPKVRLLSEIEAVFTNVIWMNKFAPDLYTDIFLADYAIAIEYDGYGPIDRVDADRKTNRRLCSRGIRVFRVRDSQLKRISRHDVLVRVQRNDLTLLHIKELLKALQPYVTDESERARLDAYLECDQFQNSRCYKLGLAQLCKPLGGDRQAPGKITEENSTGVEISA